MDLTSNYHKWGKKIYVGRNIIYETDLKLSFQSKSVDEGVSHMKNLLEAWCFLILWT